MQASAPSPQSSITLENNRRILLVDDNEAIHQDFRKILTNDTADAELDNSAAELFGGKSASVPIAGSSTEFELDSAFQGQEAVERVRAALKAGRPYAMAFMDVRMPPGWDGIETASRIWAIDPDIQIVICTAYSDYSWREMMTMVTYPEQLLILKKPFDSIEVRQFAHALTDKWTLLQASRSNTDELNRTVNERTWELKTTIALLESEIAGHKAADERVREQAELLDRGGDAIITRGLDDAIISWNSGAEHLYGWSTKEAIGNKAVNLLHSTPTDENAWEARRAVLEDSYWRGTLTQTTKSGNIVHVECHWTLMSDDKGKPKSIVEVNRDITEKRQLESQFLRAQRVEGIGSLATGIAHDLTNLLSPILFGVNALKNSTTGKAKEQLLVTIEQNSQKAIDVVKQVLCFAKGVQSAHAEVDPAQIVDQFEKMFREALPNSIQFRTNVAPNIWPVMADITQMQQVLLNLCVNARDAMPKGGLIQIGVENITINATYAASVWGLVPGPYVQLNVSDTGAGISRDQVGKIFEPFYTTKGPEKGTGLGLSTAFGIIKNHHGAITVRSEVGAGTTFHIYLPAVPSTSRAS